MKALNSVLLEGILTLVLGTDSLALCELNSDGTVYLVRAIGRLAASITENTAEGRGVRIVGRLAGAYIHAAHVEYKPIAKSKADVIADQEDEDMAEEYAVSHD